MSGQSAAPGRAGRAWVNAIDGAGHAFFNWAGASHRPQQAADGWEKVFDFYELHLG